MKAVVKFARGPGNVELRDTDDAPLGPQQFRLQVRAAGLCGSDLHVLHDTINFAIDTPVVMGHELVGTVVEKGAGADPAVAIGDRVVAEPSISVCGHCRSCRSEHYNLCPERKVMGYWYDGAFAPRCVASFVHPVPDAVPDEAAALTELLACCVHSVIEQAGVEAGDVVAVIGPGPVGVTAALVAQAAGGQAHLIGTAADRDRLRHAAQLGIAGTVDSAATDPQEAIAAVTGGEGADVVVECSGAPAGIELALALVRRRGRYTQMGLPGSPVTVDFERIAYRELQVSGGVGQRRPAWTRALTLMSRGLIDMGALITHRLPLASWQQGFDLAASQAAMKVLFTPEAATD